MSGRNGASSFDLEATDVRPLQSATRLSNRFFIHLIFLQGVLRAAEKLISSTLRSASQGLHKLRCIASIWMLQIRSATLGEPYLPPGSLSLLGLLRRRKDDHYFLTCQQHYGPIFKTLWSNQLAVCVIGLELGQRLLAEHGESVTPITIRIDSLVSKGFLRSMSGPEHEHYRHVLAASLEPSVVEPWNPMLRRLVHSTLTNLAVEQRELAGPSRHLQQSFDKIATSALLMLVYGATHDSNTFRSLHAAYHRLRTATPCSRNWSSPKRGIRINPINCPGSDWIHGRAAIRVQASNGPA